LQGRERVGARGFGQHRRKGRAVGKGLGEQAVISCPGDFDPAKARQVRRQKLGVEQAVPAETQPRDEVDERDLARISGAAEHALAKESGTERDTIEPADQIPVSPRSDTVRSAAGEERRIKPHDLIVDPGVGTLFGGFRASEDNVLERAVAADLEAAAPDNAAQLVRHVEPVKRQNSTAPRIDPEQLGVIGRFGHGEDTGGVGGEQKFGGQPNQASAPFTTIWR